MIPSDFAHALKVISGSGDDLRILALDGVSLERHPARCQLGWDSIPICSRFEVTIHDFGIQTLPPLETQKQAYTYFSEALYPFDWIEFLSRRVRQTFPGICMDVTTLRARMTYILSLLQGQRPALSFAWLRFVIHSVPTLPRLHDDGFPHCPWCDVCNIDVSHVLCCPEFETAVSFLDLGPKWRKLQLYLDFYTAIRLSGEDAICHLLGLHLPFEVQGTHFPFHHLGCARAFQLAFKQVCTHLYVKLHVFTAMRRKLTTAKETGHSAHGSTNELESYVQSALLTLAI